MTTIDTHTPSQDNDDITRIVAESKLIRMVKTLDEPGVQAALAAGVNPNLIDNSHRTLLYIAVSQGNPVITEALLKAGANINKNIGKTPLHVACSHQPNLAIIALLLTHNANVDARTGNNGITPLMYVLMNDECRDEITIAAINMLITAGANINAADRDGLTALHFAARSRHGSEVYRTLFEFGADPMQETTTGATAYDITGDRVEIIMDYMIKARVAKAVSVITPVMVAASVPMYYIAAFKVQFNNNRGHVFHAGLKIRTNNIADALYEMFDTYEGICITKGIAISQVVIRTGNQDITLDIPVRGFY